MPEGDFATHFHWLKAEKQDAEAWWKSFQFNPVGMVAQGGSISWQDARLLFLLYSMAKRKTKLVQGTSYSHLASLLHVSRKTVKRLILKLEKWEVAEVLRRRRIEQRFSVGLHKPSHKFLNEFVDRSTSFVTPRDHEYMTVRSNTVNGVAEPNVTAQDQERRSEAFDNDQGGLTSQTQSRA